MRKIGIGIFKYIQSFKIHKNICIIFPKNKILLIFKFIEKKKKESKQMHEKYAQKTSNFHILQNKLLTSMQ